MSRAELIAALVAAAPPGLNTLDAATVARLEVVTAMLRIRSPEAHRSAEDFEGTGRRRLVSQQGPLCTGIEGCTVLVTGGTGCIGSELLKELQGLAPARLVSLSRGVAVSGTPHDGVEYRKCDIRREAELTDTLRQVRPNVVFHLAAQRDPGLAERTVRESLDTNIFGTRNVLRASVDSGVSRFVYASTGKALRPFTPHIYAASKKIGELLCMSTAHRHEMQVDAARFTHVVDNSLVLHRFREVRRGEAMRLHDPHIFFYTQSAREAAQLLLVANAAKGEREVAEVFAIRDLGMPTNLLDLALAVVSESPEPRAIYVSGYDAGYEDSVYPGLYDPETASDVSPLLNGFEAARARGLSGIGIDASPIRIADHERVVATLSSLESGVASRLSDARLRETLNSVSMTLLECTLRLVEPELIRRLLRLTTQRRGQLGKTDRAIDDCLRRTLSPDHSRPVRENSRGSSATLEEDASADGPLSLSS